MSVYVHTYLFVNNIYVYCTYVAGFKSYEFGKLSTYLHSLKVGQGVEVRGPVGRFKYEKNSFRRIGLIAGGTGYN